jgi:hypothetical protein
MLEYLGSTERRLAWQRWAGDATALLLVSTSVCEEVERDCASGGPDCVRRSAVLDFVVLRMQRPGRDAV